MTTKDNRNVCTVDHFPEPGLPLRIPHSLIEQDYSGKNNPSKPSSKPIPGPAPLPPEPHRLQLSMVSHVQNIFQRGYAAVRRIAVSGPAQVLAKPQQMSLSISQELWWHPMV
jgi:hypothetical protein